MTREEAIKFCDTVVDAINAMASLPLYTSAL